MIPSELQGRVLELARDAGYVRPSSATHARKCKTTVGRLSKSVDVCRRQGWLKIAPGGTFTLTEEGETHLPQRPQRTDEGWGF